MCRPADQQPPHLNPSNSAALAILLNANNNTNNGQQLVVTGSMSATGNVAGLAGLQSVRQSNMTTSPSPTDTSPISMLVAAGSSSAIDDGSEAGRILNGQQQQRPKSSSSSSIVQQSQSQFMVDGVCLSEGGMNHLRSLQLDQPRRRCRAKNKASLESADGDLMDVAGMDDNDMVNIKDGTLLTPREDGRMPDVPEGYAVVQGENGSLVLRKKRQRNLQKLGIGGFQVRRPWARVKDKEEDALDNYNTAEVTLQQLKDNGGGTGTGTSTPTGNGSGPAIPTLDTLTTSTGTDADAGAMANNPNANNKPKRKPTRRKGKNKLVETYPAYLQEAFFGRELLVPKPVTTTSFLSDSLSANDSSQTARGSGSDSETNNDDVPIVAVKDPSIIHLTKEEVADLDPKRVQPVVQAVPSVGAGPALPVVPHHPVVPIVPVVPVNPVSQLVQPKPGSRASGSSAGYSPVRAHPVQAIKVKEEEEDEEREEEKERERNELFDENNEEEEEEETRALKDILPLAGDLLDSDDLVDSIMKESGDAGVDGPVDDDEEEPTSESLEADPRPELKANVVMHQPQQPPQQQQPQQHEQQMQQDQDQEQDELTDMLLSKDINLETMVVVSDSVGGLPNMDCKDVEDIFKGVLTDESQESQSADTSAHFQMAGAPVQQPQHQQQQQNAISVSSVPGSNLYGPALVRALSQQSQHGTASPGNSNVQQQQPQQLPPPCSPYFSEYSSSPGFSPAFSEPPPSPWPSSSSGGGGGASGGGAQDHGSDSLTGDGAPATANQRNALKWEADESLGLSATISAVLFANTNHPELKRDFPGNLEFNLIF